MSDTRTRTFVPEGYGELQAADSNAVVSAIADHRQAYAAYIASRNRLWDLHEAFDPDMEIEKDADIRAALTAWHGPDAPAATEAYFEADRACTAAAAAEDDAWDTFRAMVPASAADMRAWTAYVIEHSAKEDEIVNLRHALEHLSGVLAERLAA